MKEKKSVGRPRKNEDERRTQKGISFMKATFEILEELRGNESRSSFISRLIEEKYEETETVKV